MTTTTTAPAELLDRTHTAELFRVSASTIDNWRDQYRSSSTPFPLPFAPTERTVLWFRHELLAWAVAVRDAGTRPEATARQAGNESSRPRHSKYRPTRRVV